MDYFSFPFRFMFITVKVIEYRILSSYIIIRSNLSESEPKLMSDVKFSIYPKNHFIS